MSAAVVLSLIVFTPVVVGFLVGKTNASAWIPWAYVVGLPVALGAVGASMMVVGDTVGRDGYATDRAIFGFLIVLFAMFVFVANLIGTLAGVVCRGER